MKIKIKVTKEILKKSSKCRSSKLGTNCAIALAVRDIFPDAFVGRRAYDHKVNAIHPAVKIMEWIELPPSAQMFITSFDSLKPQERITMSPIDFEVEVPDSIIGEIGIGQVYKILSESKTLEHVQ